jgi:hypothetical protein
MKTIMAILWMLAAAGLFAQAAETALVREMAGTVEMKLPGRPEWEAVRAGQRLPRDALVSTGFKSQAVIVLGNSTLTVRPLTRVSIAGLFRDGNREDIALNLRAGRVRADVKPPAGGRTGFVVRSSIGTASVRGTVFEFDAFNLSVGEGTVEFAGASGAPVLVDAGGSSFVDGVTGRAAPPAETAAAGLKPGLPPGTEAAAVTVRETAPARTAPAPSSFPGLGVTVTVTF